MRSHSYNTYPHGGTCTAVIGSMTNAIKAQEALTNASVYATVIKVSSMDTNSGCAYGVTFHCSQTRAVRNALSAANIRIRKLLN